MLTLEQKSVINTKEPYVEVLAYAGTGKTYTLKQRIATLLKLGVKPSQILVLSFSKKAVLHVGENLHRKIDVHTFHAFSYSLIRKHYMALGFEKQPRKLLEGASKQRLLIKSVKNCRNAVETLLDINEIDLRTAEEQGKLLRFFDSMQGNKRLAKQLATDSESEFHLYLDSLKILGKIYKQYKKAKAEEGSVDYPDMLQHGRNLVSVAAKHWNYQYLFIDESQDMTASQSRLLKELAVCIPNVMIFGDPYQSIYGFAGGAYRDLSVLLGRNVQSYSLTRSFRLTEPNAKLINTLLHQMDVNAPRIIGRQSNLSPQLLTVKDQEPIIIDRIKIIRQKEPSATIAILARTKAQLHQVETNLLCEDINTESLIRSMHWQQFEIILNLIQLLANYKKVSISGNNEKRNIEESLLKVALVDRDLLDKKVAQACRRMFTKAANIPSLSGRYIQVCKLYLKIMRAENQNKDSVKNIRNALGRMEAYFYGQKSVEAIRERVRRMLTSPAVIAATIHAAKGLEYDYVFVLNVVQGSLPFYKQMKKGEVREELRLLYVACSRAKKQTILLQSSYYASNDVEYDKRSEFITNSVSKCVSESIE